jgi:6-methylsalicylate decarboxylase
MSEPSRIDVHHHIIPPDYMAIVQSLGISEGGGVPITEWDAGAVLEWMNRYDISTVVASCPAPVYSSPQAYLPELATRCNEFFARLVAEYPGRLAAFASVPLPDPEAACKELEYSLDTLKLDGVCFGSHVAGKYLGDPAQRELFEELERRHAVVFIHPYVEPGADIPLPYLPPFLIEFVFETTRAVANLLFTGTLERCPNVRFILSHAGGTVPYIEWRLLLGQFLPHLAEQVPQGVETYLRSLYYDTALAASPHALTSLQTCTDLPHILFGSDYPPAPELATMASIQGLQDYDGFDDESLHRIFRGNALELFPRLAAG